MDCDMSDVEDSSEFFWGCELNEGHREVTWSVKDESTADEDDDDNDDDEDYLIHTLFIKLATLGKCAQKEENIVQVETTTYTGNTIKQPILNMIAGVNSTIPLDLSFDGKFKVTFRLTDGVGPVYLSGQHLVEFPEDDFSEDESDYTDDTGTEMTSDDDDDVKKPKIKVGKKRTGSPGKSIKAKRSKLGPKGNDSDSEDDDEDDDEETVKVEKPKKKKGKIGVSPKLSGKKLSSKKKSGSTALKKAKKTTKK